MPFINCCYERLLYPVFSSLSFNLSYKNPLKPAIVMFMASQYNAFHASIAWHYFPASLRAHNFTYSPQSIRKVLKLYEKKLWYSYKVFSILFFLPVEPLSSPLLLDNNLYEAEVRFFSFDYRINANYSVTQLLCHWRNAQALCSLKQEKTLAFNREASVLKQSSLTLGESLPGRGDSHIKRTGVLVGNFE